MASSESGAVPAQPSRRDDGLRAELRALFERAMADSRASAARANRWAREDVNDVKLGYKLHEGQAFLLRDSPIAIIYEVLKGRKGAWTALTFVGSELAERLDGGIRAHSSMGLKTFIQEHDWIFAHASEGTHHFARLRHSAPPATVLDGPEFVAAAKPSEPFGMPDETLELAMRVVERCSRASRRDSRPALEAGESKGNADNEHEGDAAEEQRYMDGMLAFILASTEDMLRSSARDAATRAVRMGITTPRKLGRRLEHDPRFLEESLGLTPEDAADVRQGLGQQLSKRPAAGPGSEPREAVAVAAPAAEAVPLPEMGAGVVHGVMRASEFLEALAQPETS